MPARTIKGLQFTIVIEGTRITVKHVPGKGRRCRVIVPPGVRIESEHKSAGLQRRPDVGIELDDRSNSIKCQ